jgi:ABC-2 type transport system ATP-binding protein
MRLRPLGESGCSAPLSGDQPPVAARRTGSPPPSVQQRRRQRLRQQLGSSRQIARARCTSGLLSLPGEEFRLPQPAVEIRGLCKTFGSHLAVDHLSLSVRRGEIYGLLGPNGSGKTTTINMLSGLLRPTSGTIRILGHVLADEEAPGLSRVRYGMRWLSLALQRGQTLRQVHRLLGAVPQETALYDELTAWTNMQFHADLYGVPRSVQKARIFRMLELVGLLERADARVGTFSGGMKRRLAIARALLHDPQLLYLDEPTLGVDVQSRRAIWEYILLLREQGKTVLLTTNYLEEARVLCDRLAIIDHGRLITVDTPARLKARFGRSAIKIETREPLDALALQGIEQLPGVSGISQDGTLLTVSTSAAETLVPQLITRLSPKSDLLGVTIEEPTLDDIFLQLTGKTLRD